MSEQNGNKNRYELDAKQIFDIIVRRWWITVISVVLLTAAALGYSHYTNTVKYTSSATFLMNGDTGMSSYQQILAGQYQSNDYPYILMSRNTLEEVEKRLNEKGSLSGKKYTAGEIAGMVSCQSMEDSRIFKISVTTPDSEDAYIIAQEVSEVFKLRAQELTKTEIGFVETPGKPSASSTGNYKRNAVLGAAIGAVIGVALSIVLGLGNDVLNSEDWLIEKYKESAPLLSSIPNSASSGGRGYYKYKYKYKSYNYSSNSDKK